MNILHVAPINVAGVPLSMVEMHRRFGHTSRLVTLHRNALTFPEDICLNIPLPRSFLSQLWREYKRTSSPQSVSNNQSIINNRLLVHGPKNLFEQMYFTYDDWRREDTVLTTIEKYGLEQFDVIHYDGGLDFFRDARIAQRWKQAGKKIVCHYMGSDLRARGIDTRMDELSDLNLTNESDHLLLHPNIHYIYIPFDASLYSVHSTEHKRLRIVHSPSNRSAKGTELILPVIERVRKVRDVEFVLIEGKPHDEVVRIKQECDIAIEQVGNYGGTGYGRNSLETLAMGIPTITEMTPDYVAWLPENPFILATQETLFERLIELIDTPDLRKQKALHGRIWVEKYHSFEAVNSRLTQLYREYGIAS
ncbi:MAG TPA: glycosyltransferase [Bacteroidota bacterium]